MHHACSIQRKAQCTYYACLHLLCMHRASLVLSIFLHLTLYWSNTLLPFESLIKPFSEFSKNFDRKIDQNRLIITYYRICHSLVTPVLQNFDWNPSIINSRAPPIGWQGENCWPISVISNLPIFILWGGADKSEQNCNEKTNIFFIMSNWILFLHSSQMFVKFWRFPLLKWGSTNSLELIGKTWPDSAD